MSTPAPKRRRVDDGSASKPVRFTFDGPEPISSPAEDSASMNNQVDSTAVSAAASAAAASAAAAAAAAASTFTMGMVPPVASTSQGAGNAGSDGEDDAEMGLDERDLAESKKIMLKLLVQVGSDAKVDRDTVASQQLPALAGAIAGDVEDGLGDFIAGALLSCVTAFSHKTDIYSSLLGCINEEDGEFAEDVVNKTLQSLAAAVVSGATRDVKLLLRFMCFWPSVRLCTLDQLFGGCLRVIVDACVGAPEQARRQADEAVGAIMFALIWCHKALASVESDASSISALLNRIQTEYMAKRSSGAGKPPSQSLIFPDAASLRDNDALSSLFECLSGRVGVGVDADVASALETILVDRAESVCRHAAQNLDEAEVMDLPEFSLAPISEWECAKKGHGQSSVREVRLFGDGGCGKNASFSWGGSYREKTLSAISSVDRLCMRDLVLDLLATHAPRSDETVAALLRCSFPGAEHLVLESIFVAMLTPPYLPNQDPSWCFFAGIIVRICKASKEYPPTLAETFDVLFDGVAGFPSKNSNGSSGQADETESKRDGSEGVKAESTGKLAHPVCVRLCEWFSWHLSQLKWKWPWKRLTGCLDSSIKPASAESENNRAGVAPQKVFLSALFQYLCRLSYHDLVREVIPEGLLNLMPYIKNAPTNNYRFPDTSSPDESMAYCKFFDKLRTVFNDHDESSDGNLFEWLQSDESPLKSAMAALGENVNVNSADFQKAVLDDSKALHIVTVAILQSGHKTLTHALARADRFGSLLYRMSRAYGTLQECGVAIVDACAVFFSDTPHYWFCVVDGLIQREYISVSAFARWILRKSHYQISAGYHLWNYLQLSVQRVSARYFTRSASSAAAVPKLSSDMSNDEVDEDERKQSIYDVFDAFKQALSDHRDGSEAEVTEWRKIVRQHGEILVAIVKDCSGTDAGLDMSQISL